MWFFVEENSIVNVILGSNSKTNRHNDNGSLEAVKRNKQINNKLCTNDTQTVGKREETM